MATPIPLHPNTPQPEDPLDDPAVLFFNAALHEGTWEPAAYGITRDMLEGYSHAWSFIEDVVRASSVPPTVQHFARTFPTIEMLAGVPIEYAAEQLKKKHYERELRRQLMQSIASINDGDLEGAREAVLAVAQPSPVGRPKGLDVMDPDSVLAIHEKPGWNVPWPYLKELTGGHPRGELWYFGARLGQGKSWLGPQCAISAARQGAKVAILSAEMPKRRYVARIQSCLAGGDKELRAQLQHSDENRRVKAVKSLPSIAGKIEVLDPSDVRMSLGAIERVVAGNDYVVVDHMGLLTDHKGNKAIEDHRVQGLCSNVLREYSLRYETSILGLIQINREGDNAHSTPPKISQIAGSDEIGKDGSVIMLFKRMGIRAVMIDVPKNRESVSGRFYTYYDPANADFHQITKQEACDIQAVDGDRLANI